MKGAASKIISIDTIEAEAEALLQSGGRMQMVYTLVTESGDLELRYLTAPPLDQPFMLWRIPSPSEPPSLARIWPLIGWYEREIMDLYGLRFRDHPEPLPLLPRQIKGQPLSGPNGNHTRPPAKNGGRSLPDVAKGVVQELPFGPIRADVLESAEFMFFYIGEHIIHYHPDLFVKHRGMESRFEGLSPEHGVIMAERVSGVGTVAHALAYCQAVEAAADCSVPARAQSLRVLIAELERVYNHLHYLGHLCNTTTLKVGEAQGKLLEERAKQINAKLTGSRFLRSLLTPGGLRRDLAPGNWLSGELEALRAETARYAALLETSDSHLDRLLTTGILDRKVAFDQGATGPIDRASGVDRDLRRDHPYAFYADVPVEVPVFQEGDAYARARVRVAEIDASFVIMQRILLLLPEGGVRTPCSVAPGTEGLGWSESPRGTLFYAVHFGPGGRLSRVKIKSPSFSNWRAFPQTVHNSNMMDYAINEASFGLTIAGCAR